MSTDSRPSDEEIQRRLDFADGALGAAGHKVDDPESRALMREVASGEKTADEAVAELKARIKDA
jgi:hypothetical protein